jgi:DNA (cytosine-5)-methyltransferase 1
MIHLGDITKIDGSKIPPVDVITGGSPCQDLSVAGKREGLNGERSGLFMEQIRIVKEMRHATGADVDIRLAKPRYMVWENVPGAFSSNKGKDFQAVLTEIIRIAQPDAPDVPMPKNAKWGGAGCLYDDLGRWSVAWRVHDAQFWGVPQRRKRIALVADFGGLSAPEILFERKGLSWHSESSETEREGTAGRIEDCVRESGEIVVEPRTQDGCARVYRGITPTLNTASGGQRQPCVICLQGNGIDRADTAGCNGRGWNDEGGGIVHPEHHRPSGSRLFKRSGGNDERNRKLDSNYQKPDERPSTVGALQARDYKGVGNQYVEEGKVIIQHCRPSDT